MRIQSSTSGTGTRWNPGQFFLFTEKARMVCIPLVTLTLSGHAPFSALLCIDRSSRERKGNNANLFVMTLRAT